MPRPKSIIKKVDVDLAKRSHSCQHVPSHQIKRGDKRLKLSVDRTYEHFCVECAIQIIDSDIQKLLDIKEQLTK